MDRRFAALPADALLLFAAALIAVVTLALGYAAAWPLALDVGGRDARFAVGFNEPERSAGLSYRWTDGDSTLALPRPPASAPALLALRLQNGRPPGQPPAQVALSADGRELARLELRDNLFRTYSLLVPPAEGLDWALRIRLMGDSILLAADPRPLGVVVDRAALAPLAGAPALPTAWVALWAAALGALAYALPRLAGAARGASLAMAALVAVFVAALVVALPLDVLPFVQRFAALAGIGCLGVVVARVLAPPILTNDERRTTNDQRPAPDHRLPTSDHRPATTDQRSHGTANVRHSSFVVGRAVRGEHLPIYLAVAWWMMPLFQLAMIWDGAPGVGLAPQTLWIGAGLLAALAGLGVRYALRLRTRQTNDQRPTTNDQHTADDAKGGGERSSFVVRRSSARAALANRALVILALAAGAHLIYSIWYAYTRSAPDFWILFRGAREWTRGGSLYDLTAVMTNHFGHVFKVPPFYGMLFVPFVTLDGFAVLFYHRVMNTALILATALVWLRMWRLPLRSLAAAGVLILLNFRPLADTLAFGQIDLVLLLLLTLALWALRLGARDLGLGASNAVLSETALTDPHALAPSSQPLAPGASPSPQLLVPDLHAGALVALGTQFKI
jgi:hypothetical protein